MADAGERDLKRIHTRFARSSLALYLAVSALALALLVVSLVTDLAHEQDQLRERLLLETVEREHFLAQHLNLLVQELRRLGLRSEVDLFDETLAPERSLLRLAHDKSTFFNLGVAILDREGALVWAEPQSFLPPGTNFGVEPWFAAVRRSRSLRIVPVDPDRAGDAVLYVVSSIVRNGEFAGALLGAIDLGTNAGLLPRIDPSTGVETAIATQSGKIVYPPTPPAFAAEPSWKALFAAPESRPSTATIDLLGRRKVVARSPIAGTELIYVLLADEEALFHGARARLRSRLAFGLALAAAPLGLLVLLLQRSLAKFRLAEEQALRQERLRLVGEAANQIAHEVKNSLNGIKMAVEMACDPRGPSARSERALVELRSEIARLSSFTSDLMIFSKGVVPHCTRIDLEEFVPRAISLLQDAAAKSGSALDVALTGAPLIVEADPSLLHIVLANLVTNAIEAVSVSSSGEPRVRVWVRAEDRWAKVGVSDNGPGVAETVRARLFEPFQSGKPSGVGIGLALSRRIAVAHGGDLVLDPAVHGATFTLSLPRTTA